MKHRENLEARRPVVFIGPSMPANEARQIVDADFRAPCKRGDLTKIPSGTLVGLVDGVFHQNDAVSPREIVFALKRGITILGSSSMGALRAAEVPGIEGVGQVYRMFKDGVIDDDDEVALVFNPETFTPLSVPLVNVRYAVDRLRSSGTIAPSVGEQIVDAAQKLPYPQRTYPAILERAGLGAKPDASDLSSLLKTFDLKRDDARLLLERLAQMARDWGARLNVTKQTKVRSMFDYGGSNKRRRTWRKNLEGGEAPIHIWETGDTIRFSDLVLFLKLVGKFELYASNAITLLLDTGELGNRRKTRFRVKEDLEELCRSWGWLTTEEQRITLRDLGVPLPGVARQLESRRRLQELYRRCALSSPEAFLKSLRYELLSNDIALKREAMRCASFGFSRDGDREPKSDIDSESIHTLCRLHRNIDWGRLRIRLQNLGVSDQDLAKFASAARHARERANLVTAPTDFAESVDADRAFGLSPSRKAMGSDRFSTQLRDAYELTNRLKTSIGITRVGMINGLAELDAAHVSQVARPAGAWSSSYGSGKSDTKEGAIVGGILEEVEKWSQEQFRGQPVVDSYRGLCARTENALDPAQLDLPFDSRFDSQTRLAWQPCVDLISGSPILIPLAAVACPFNAPENNPFYSARGGRVIFSTNGLASGFTLAEALVHATCEYIERHATRMCELRVENPGLHDRKSWPRRVDLGTLPRSGAHLVEKLRDLGYDPSFWDITSEVRVATVLVRLVKDGQLARGWATHPNPTVAAHMAALEACQSIASRIAAGREDLTVQARSLGRHERPNPIRAAAELFWQIEDKPGVKLSDLPNCAVDDLYKEFCWIRRKLHEAGLKHLIAVDLSRDELAPVRVVRVLIPGLETTNPFYCGPRARRELVSELI